MAMVRVVGLYLIEDQAVYRVINLISDYCWLVLGFTPLWLNWDMNNVQSNFLHAINRR